MGKMTIDSPIADLDEFDTEQDVDTVPERAVNGINKDMRRRLEDKLAEARLARVLNEYDFRDL